MNCLAALFSTDTIRFINLIVFSLSQVGRLWQPLKR
jgi:hypothetical protein